MPLRPGTHRIGPAQGTVQVKTYREGVAQKVGHDLIIDVGQWEATVEVGEDGAPTAISLDVDSGSLQVREGLRGVKPLTDKDRGDIRGTIDDKILRRQPVSFRCGDVGHGEGRLTARGELTIVGTSRPASFDLEVSADGRVRGTLPVTQTEWGIKPYRGLMGALKVRDTVEVTVDAQLPAD